MSLIKNSLILLHLLVASSGGQDLISIILKGLLLLLLKLQLHLRLPRLIQALNQHASLADIFACHESAANASLLHHHPCLRPLLKALGGMDDIDDC